MHSHGTRKCIFQLSCENNSGVFHIPQGVGEQTDAAAGDHRRVVESTGDLAVLRTNLQFAGYYGADA